MGKTKFARPFSPQTGLGPLFNDNSCLACHGDGASGGHSERTVLLAGAMLNGGPSLLEHVGGPMIQDKVLTGFAPERVPAEATALTRRISPPVWGLGLIEAIPKEAILAQMRPDETKRALGIRGLANWEKGELGRFGWKAQKSSVVTFTEQAFSWELGISTPGRLEEPVPNAPPRQVAKPDISRAEFEDVVAYQRYLGAPPRGEVSWKAQRGETLFSGVGCVHCHVPSHTTGPNAWGIPTGLTVELYSDLLLHQMDEALADHMVQGAATGQMFRTPPLWGLRLRKRFLHDGRTTDLAEAVALHGGEAAQVVANWRRLSDDEKRSLETFLRTL